MGVVLFVREDLLKASHYKLITVAGHTRRGKWIDPYQANVLVSDDHDTDKVAAGQGSHYQKQAHKKLAEKVEGFHTMNPDAKASIILAQATKMQKEASQSAALSNWKKEALAGNNPKPSMWAAFYALDNAGRAALLSQVGSKVGDTDHLHAPSNPNLQPAQAPVNSAQAAIETVAHTDDLPHKVKDKLDGWATDGYVDRLQDAANDNGSSSAYSAYAKKLLAQFEPPAGPTVDTPVPADAKKTMDSMFANGNKELLQAVADNNSANPHVAAYAKKLLDQLKTEPVGETLKDWPGTKFVLKDGQWEAHDVVSGHKSVEGPELSAALFIKIGKPVPYTIASKLSDKSKAAIVKDAAAEFGISTMDAQALLMGMNNPDPWHPSNLSEGDTKVEDGKTYVLKDGHWNLVDDDDHAKHKAAVAAFETGAFYQKEALKKLKAEHGPAWHAMHPAKQHDLAQAKYQALQGAASQAAAVSGWKKNILAGKVPTPGEVKAFAAMAAQDSDKAGKLLVEVQKVIGGDKLALLVSQAHAKAAQAAKTAPVPGNMTFEPVAKPAVVVTKDKPAAPPKNEAKDKLSQPLQDFVMLFKFHGGPIAQGQTIEELMDVDPALPAAFKAATPDEKATVAAAVSFYGPHKLQLFMDWVSAQNAKDAVPKKVPVLGDNYVNTQPGHNKFWSVSTHGNDMMTVYGKIGTKGSTTIKQFSSKSAALAAAHKLALEKLGKGYKFSGATTHVHSSTAGASSTASAAATLLNVGKPAPAAPAKVVVTAAPPVKLTPTLKKLMAIDPSEVQVWLSSAAGGGGTNAKNSFFDQVNALSKTKFHKWRNSGAKYGGLNAAYGQKCLSAAICSLLGMHDQVLMENGEFAKFGPDAAKSPPVTDVAKIKEAVLAFKTGTKVAPVTTAGWTHQASDGALSGAPSLTAETSNGYTYYVAYTDDNQFQVGVIDAEGNPDDHYDFQTAGDAAAQMGILVDGNDAGINKPTEADISKLGPSASSAVPKDGDTKPGANGTTLVFKDGRWHTQAKPDAIAVPDFTFDKSVWGPRYTLVAAALKSAFEAGGAKAIKSLVILKKDGTIRVKGGLVAGVGALATGPNNVKPRQKLMFAYVKAMLESNAKGGAKVAFTTSPPTAAAPKAATPKPAAPKAAPPEPIKPAVIFTTEPGKPKVTPMDGWTQIGPQKGSNPGGKFKDKNGKEWYCKFPATEDHAKNELLASKLYLAAGVDAPSLRLVSQNGKVGIASKFVDGVTKVGAGIKSAPGAIEGFAVDAWLGNYDSVGTGFDNLLKNKDGKAVRIDVGGSILYRAQGAPKGDAYGDVVNEIDAMRDPAKNQYGAAVFSGITKDQLNNSVALVLDIPDDVIQQLVEKFGPGTKQEKAALTAKLIARKKDLAKRFPDADLIANPPKPDPRHLPVEPSKLPKKLDFLNWKGQGQGLSGTAKVNEVNQKAVDEIYASAMAGDYVAFKKLQFHVVDKSTGAVSTGSSFGSHPSQHIKDFYSLVMDYMEVIANPAAKKQKVWETEDYSDITELSDAFKAHYYGVTVGQVPANQRLGYWISLGQADAAASFMPAKVEYISAADKAKGSASTKGMTAILKKWMAAVKKTGSANQPYRDGKEIDNSGLKTRDVLTDAYAHAVELTEGTRITKGMDMPDAMLQQMIALPDGHVFQNPGSMCCSKNEDWGWGGNTRLKIIYAKGAKALYNIGVGQYNGEGEITTVPGQRFMLLKKDMKSKPPEFTLLMLPPDETYVANIKPKATP